MNNSKLSINKAAATWGISRNTLYKAIGNGTLSKDEAGKIDASEMARVFGSSNKKPSAEQPTQDEQAEQLFRTTPKSVPTNQIEQELRSQISKLEEQLQDAKEREYWLREQINELMPKKITYQTERKGLLSRFFR